MIQEYVQDAWETYLDKPKWFFNFQDAFSHDYHNNIGAIDGELHSFLSWFHDSGYLNDTLLVVMSDHGSRYSAIRATHQGKLEERMPFFYFKFPQWVEERYPIAINNFRENSRRLTGPYDIHPTMMDLLSMDNTEEHESVR